jgi:hypothetical protein
MLTFYFLRLPKLTVPKPEPSTPTVPEYVEVQYYMNGPDSPVIIDARMYNGAPITLDPDEVAFAYREIRRLEARKKAHISHVRHAAYIESSLPRDENRNG